MDAQRDARLRNECETDRLIHYASHAASAYGNNYTTHLWRELLRHGMTVTPIRSTNEADR